MFDKYEKIHPDIAKFGGATEFVKLIPKSELIGVSIPSMVIYFNNIIQYRGYNKKDVIEAKPVDRLDLEREIMINERRFKVLDCVENNLVFNTVLLKLSNLYKLYMKNYARTN